MLLWIAFAAMSAIAVGVVLRPLLMPHDAAPGGGDHETEVYRDQLSELERDRARALISDSEAENARAEIARRLIASSEQSFAAPSGSSPAWRRFAAMTVLVAVPAISLGSYLWLGSPDLPPQPFADRQAAPVESADLASLVGRVERHLQENPNDAAGWDVIGPAYMRLRRYSDAADAFARAIRLGGETARRLSALGEARMFRADGMIDVGARQAFEQAAALDTALPSPRYYLGLAAVQDGDTQRANQIWTDLLATSPSDAPWVREVKGQLTRLRALEAGGEVSATAPPGPSAEDIASAGAMSDEQRSSMIEGMVERLASRLEEDGSNLEGWLRLARAYVVLDRADDARAALASAREAFNGQAELLARLDETARELGLGS